MRPFGDWFRELGIEKRTEEDACTDIMDKDLSTYRPKPIENSGHVYNEWGNLEPSEHIVAAQMADDGWREAEVVKQQLEEDAKVRNAIEAAWRSVFNED